MLYKLKKLLRRIMMFKPLLNVTFILKSGKEINIQCEDMKINDYGNDLRGYTIVKMKPANNLMYCRIEDISAIVVND